MPTKVCSLHYYSVLLKFVVFNFLHAFLWEQDMLDILLYVYSKTEGHAFEKGLNI